jgi:hypothetical protein
VHQDFSPNTPPPQPPANSITGIYGAVPRVRTRGGASRSNQHFYPVRNGGTTKPGVLNQKRRDLHTTKTRDIVGLPHHKIPPTEVGGLLMFHLHNVADTPSPNPPTAVGGLLMLRLHNVADTPSPNPTDGSRWIVNVQPT